MTLSIIFLILFACVALYVHGLVDLARGRKYKSGTGWCAWRWSDVESEYILRLHIVKTPWFAVCLHWIRKPDAEPYLHDHPVSFLSIILRGRYAEIRASGDGDVGHRVHRWYNVVRARQTDRHRIIFCRANTLTLCFMGPKTRDWGFHMPEGWVMWKDYYARLKAGENLRNDVRLLDVVELQAAFEKIHADFLAKCNSKVFVDEEVRCVSTVPGDFDDEAQTTPYGERAFGEGPFGGGVKK